MLFILQGEISFHLNYGITFTLQKQITQVLHSFYGFYANEKTHDTK